MKRLIITMLLLTLASCATPPTSNEGWGKWGEPNYVRNHYATAEVMQPSQTPLIINTGWNKR